MSELGGVPLSVSEWREEMKLFSAVHVQGEPEHGSCTG